MHWVVQVLLSMKKGTVIHVSKRRNTCIYMQQEWHLYNTAFKQIYNKQQMHWVVQVMLSMKKGTVIHVSKRRNTCIYMQQEWHSGCFSSCILKIVFTIRFSNTNRCKPNIFIYFFILSGMLQNKVNVPVC